MKRTRRLWLATMALLLALVTLAVLPDLARADDGQDDPHDLANAIFGLHTNVYPAGEPVVLDLVVWDANEVELEYGTHYYLQYRRGYNDEWTDDPPSEAGGYRVRAVAIEGGGYVGDTTETRYNATFDLVDPYDLRYATLDVENCRYTGKAVVPEVTLTDIAGRTLQFGTDFTLTYKSGGIYLSGSPVDPGYYTATVEPVDGSDYYASNRLERDFIIYDWPALALGESAEIQVQSGSKQAFEFTASEAGRYMFLARSTSLIEGGLFSHPTLSYSDEIESHIANPCIIYTELAAGQTVYLEVSPYGSGATLDVSVRVVKGYDLCLCDVSAEDTSFVEDGSPHEPTGTVLTRADTGETLVEGADFVLAGYAISGDGTSEELSTEPPSAAGSYKVVFEGRGTYSGTLSLPFVISSITDLSVATCDLHRTEYVTAGDPIDVAATVVAADGTTLAEGTHYRWQCLARGDDLETGWVDGAPRSAGQWWLRAVALESGGYTGSVDAANLISVEAAEQLSLGVRTEVTDVVYSRDWTGVFTAPAEGSYVFVTGMYDGEGGPTNDSAYLYADSAFTKTINVGHAFPNVGHGVEVSADLEAGQTVYLRTWVTHDQGIAVVRLAQVTTSQAKYLATDGSDTPAVVVRYDDGAVLEEGTDYELEWWDCGADGDYQLLEGVPSKTGNYMVNAVGPYGIMLGDAFFSIVDPARLTLGSSVHAYTYDGGSDWLGMFTAPAAGTYTFVSMGSEDVTGPASLYADLTLNEPLARDDSRSLDGSNFKVCCDLAKGQTVYLVLEAYGDSCYVAVGEGGNFAGYTLIDNMSIAVGTDTFVADGRGHTPQDVVIRDARGVQLIQGTDYAVASYYNVKTSETLDSMPADPGYYRVIYEGKGAYAGTLGAYFEIQDPHDLSYATMTMASDDRSRVATYLVDGKPRVPQVSVVDLAGRTLELGLDYVLQYHTYGTDWTLEAPSEAGNYWFVEAVPAEGSDYVGSCEPDRGLGAEWFDIVEPRELVVGTTEDVVFEHGVAVFTAPVSDVYTFAVGELFEGNEVVLWSTYACPGFTNSIGALQGRYTSKTLRLEEGQTIYLTGFDYYGSVSVKQGARDLKNAVVKVAEQTWTGKPLTPAPTVMLGGATLTEEIDYTVSYQANTDPGTATVTVAGKGLYTGTKSASFVVSCPASKLSVTAKAKTYTGKQLLPTVVVELGSTKLVQGTDYSVSYKDKTGKKAVAASNVKTAGTYTVVIAGKGSYSGTKTISYTINKAANPMKAAAKAKKVAVRQAALAKKAQTVQAVKFSKAAQGSVTYKNVSAKAAVKKWKVSSKGVVSVPKGTKKGTYALKLAVTAKGNANYRSSKAQTVTVTVVVG